MRYRLTDRLNPLTESETLSEADSYVQVLDREDFLREYPELAASRPLARGLEHARFCKAELLPGCAAGTLAVPRKDELLKPGLSLAYYLDGHRLLLLGDHETAEKLLSEMQAVRVPEGDTARFFFEFLETLVRDDAAFLQKYENHLDDLEERVLESEVKNFDNKLHFYRKGLLRLSSYYSQLSDLADTLADNLNGMFSETDCRAFDLFAGRAARLSSQTRALREYSLQLHEIYQSKMEARQNKIMQFLTVVTTIFMPLTLIAGWYGMNFTDMPELRAPFAYPIVIAVSALVILAEILYFWRKKWFK